MDHQEVDWGMPFSVDLLDSDKELFIWCRTLEDYKSVCEILASRGLKYASGGSLIDDHEKRYDNNRSNTYLRVSRRNESWAVTFGNVTRPRGYTKYIPDPDGSEVFCTFGLYQEGDLDDARVDMAEFSNLLTGGI